VTWLGCWFLGLPIAAALALGAIVAPPDAVAATAVLGSVSIPRSSDAVLRGESLFNDATALLLFSGALAVVAHGHLDGPVALHLAIAVPGGILLGIAFAFVAVRIQRFIGNTLGGNLLQFVNCFLVWIVADRLELSAVLCLVAFCMTIARTAWPTSATRMRVHSNSVWRSVVFALNVFAFFIMGMQARTIVGHMRTAELARAFAFSGLVVVAVIVTRLVVLLAYNRYRAAWHAWRGGTEPATLAQGIFVGWAGMRGLVTVATAFALPAGFPQRDTLVLAAFIVVLATLVVQGATLAPLIRLLHLSDGPTLDEKLADVRADLTDVALEALHARSGPEAENLRFAYTIKRQARTDAGAAQRFELRRELGLEMIAAQRKRLGMLHADYEIGCDEFDAVEETLDWHELALLPDESRRVDGI